MNWEDFRNFEKKVFCFPHSTSTCKFDHYYLLEIWVSFWRFYLNFGEIPPYLTLKYISKMKFVLHMGDLIQKNDFFLLCFFQFHQHVVTFSSKNYVKMKSSIVKTITKNSSKIEKIMKFFHRFSNIFSLIFHQKVYLMNTMTLFLWDSTVLSSFSGTRSWCKA